MLSTQVSEGAAGRAGFTRVDLIVTVVLALALAGGAWALVPGERMRGAMCAHHLGSLGKSVHQYARAREGGLPAAGVNLDKVQTTWDLELAPYLDGGSGKDDSGEAARKAQRHFLCPSDKMTHSGVARSYAMSGHDMSPLNWPAGAQAVSGVGLKWDKAAVLTLLDEKALGAPEALPRVKVSDIPRPARTVLVAEYIAAENTMGKFASATVSGGAQQLQGSPDGGIHRWRFNYLMVDGHVESFSPLQSGSLDGKGGIWTIKQEN